MGSLSSQAAEFVLTDASAGSDVGNWQISNSDLGIDSPAPFTVEKKRLFGGKQAGVDIIVIDR
ncbi:hypothetical protein [Zobellella endophytica]|uniref:hypothetical protein n=1 Tax=Zobellella endophytica TaxID=2116700 RepID=UPI001FE6CBEE|nr:hypothetical protein [Zobellella endophytica]